MRHSNTDKAKIIIDLLAQTIREEREKIKKSQRLLADEYDLQKSLVNRLENGINEPKIISLWSICDALDIKLSDLIKKVEKKLPNHFSLIEK